MTSAQPLTFDSPQFIHLARPGGLEVTFMDWGATWLSCRVPVPGEAAPREVLLGHATPQDHATQSGYLGATVGRYANRIGHARIERDGVTHALAPHPPGSRHQLHGGPDGFSHRRWQVLSASDTAVCFALDSPDGDQGFPGDLHVEVTYTLSDAMTLVMDIRATVSAPCPVAITQHAYFNLDARHDTVRAHTLQLAASRYLPVDAELLPLGGLASVESTGFDFRVAKPIGQDLGRDAQQQATRGYDHGWLLDDSARDARSPAAVLTSSDRRLSMALSTTLPAVQVYTGNYLGSSPARDGSPTQPHAGVAMEPGYLADSPAHGEWGQTPSVWLAPGDTLRQAMTWAWESC